MTSSHAADLLEAKLALEDELARPLYAWGVAYITSWEHGHGAIAAYPKMQWLAKLEAILSRHYARTVLVMLGKRPPKDPTLAQAALNRRHLVSLTEQVKRNATLIMASIDAELARGMTDTAIFDPNEIDDGTKDWTPGIEVKQEAPIQPGIFGITAGYTMRIGNAAIRALKRWAGKLKTIVTHNTNSVAEEARAEDAKRTPIDVVPDKQENVRLVKVWNSLMDGRERATHHAAHGQEVAVDQPFSVGGAMLRFPGDSSLGAPLSEICNCRCFVTTYAVADDGTRTLIRTGPSAPTRSYRKKPNGDPPVVTPTSQITLNGRSSGRIFLADRQSARFEQPTPSTIVIRRDGIVLGRASFANGKVSKITVAPSARNLGIEDLIRRSVEGSARMDRRPYSARP